MTTLNKINTVEPLIDASLFSVLAAAVNSTSTLNTRFAEVSVGVVIYLDCSPG